MVIFNSYVKLPEGNSGLWHIISFTQIIGKKCGELTND